MEFSATSGNLGKQRSACIVAGVYTERKLSPSAAALDAAARGAVRDLLAQGDLEGGLGSTLLLHQVPELACERVLLVGLGPEGELSESAYRRAVAAAISALRATGAAEATICLSELAVNGRDSAWKIKQAVLAAADVSYRFDRLKSQPPESRRPLEKLVFQLHDASEAAAAEASIAFAAATAEGVSLAKDLGNLPGNLCTPAYLAEQALQLGRRHGMAVTILEQTELEKLGMGALLAVARGSLQPPKLIVVEYRRGPAGAPPVVLVGKGITFDTGGLCVKPAAGMDEMKFDMCGAAAVLGALQVAATLQLPLNVVGIIPAAENMPSGSAARPGDVVTTLAGLTVEILDTDSEGRLALCDALTYARRFKPAAVVDIATLTGEIVSALGEVATGLFSTHDALARELAEAGDRAWDRVWPMPLWDDYQGALNSNFADLANVGPPPDCTVTAACFLSRFTRGYPWVHLDIAGTAARSGADKGATGRPVPLLAHFLARRAQQHSNLHRP
jgi:leucyl aminopeptidase